MSKIGWEVKHIPSGTNAGVVVAALCQAGSVPGAVGEGGLPGGTTRSARGITIDVFLVGRLGLPSGYVDR